MRITRTLHSIHQWGGLFIGLNMLLLSLTGAYLVFAEDIEAAFGQPAGERIAQIGPTSETPLQDALTVLSARHPAAIVSGVRPVEPGAPAFAITLLERPDTSYRYVLEPDTGEIHTDVESVAMELHHFILHLHADLFYGALGVIFLGVIACVFLLTTVSGIIIYAPFMKKALFSTLRFDRGLRRGAADLHKLVGSSALAFNLLMAVTGIFLTFGILGARMWAANDLRQRAAVAAAVAPEAAVSPAPQADAIPFDAVYRAAQAVHPEAPVSSVVFPGSFQGPNHYFVFHERPGKLNKFLPVYSLIPKDDPSAAEDMAVPLWIDLTMASVPLHFGNYGGPVLKVVYCLLGLGSGFLSVSGALLTLARWRKKLRLRRARRRESRRAAQPEMPAQQEA